MTFKNIKIKKKGGGTRTQRVKVLASGKYKFVPNIGKNSPASTKKSKKSSNPRSSKKKTGKVKKMTKKKRRRNNSITVPLAIIAPLAAGLAEPISNMVFNPTPETITGSLNHIGVIYTGYNAVEGSFQPEMLNRGLLPLIIGAIVHKFVGGAPLNVNRMLARAKVPFIRI